MIQGTGKPAVDDQNIAIEGETRIPISALFARSLIES